jgi:MTH538 TIR-like domain (DUF1863)
MAPKATGYDAFISYSHALDGKLAPALQTMVERFAKPWYQSRVLRVFRDTASLSANPDLWSSIEAALTSSAWLVLMASPDAARSPWVNREIAWWLKYKSSKRLLVVLSAGDLSVAGDDGSPADAALPPAMRAVRAEKSRWVDLRWLHNWTKWTTPIRGCVSVSPISPRPSGRSRRTCWWVSTSASTVAQCGSPAARSPRWRCSLSPLWWPRSSRWVSATRRCSTRSSPGRTSWGRSTCRWPPSSARSPTGRIRPLTCIPR